VAPTENQFRYRMFMMYLDLAELPQLFDRVPFWSARRRAPAWFKRSDYLGDPAVTLDTAVRNLVHERTGVRPTGPIRLLTHLRYFGYCMNPVSFYYCFDETGGTLDTIVAEITNTPWGERHQYVLAARHAGGRIKRFEFDKEFHVSPFLPMDMQYEWGFSEPEQRLYVNMRNFKDGRPVFDATLALTQEPATARALLRTLAAFPLMTLKVIAAIHWQALRLWIKGTPFYSHPRTGVARPAAGTAPAAAGLVPAAAGVVPTPVSMIPSAASEAQGAPSRMP
jgi:DUF1365 family protein